MKATEHFSLLGVLLTLGALALAGFFIGMDTLKEWVLSAGPLAPLAFIALKASTLIIAPLTGGPVYPLVGAFFGFWPGILYVAIGDFIGLTVTFWLSRIFGMPFIEKLIAKGERPLLARVVTHAGTTKGFIHMVLAFFAMPEIISYGTGLSRLRYSTFILILWPLTIIGASLLVFAGASLGDGSLLLSFAVPALAAAVFVVGGSLFVHSVVRKEKNDPA